MAVKYTQLCRGVLYIILLFSCENYIAETSFKIIYV